MQWSENPGAGQGSEGAAPVGNPDDRIDFDKLWQDHLDRGGATLAKILPSKKAELLAWWVETASQEHVAADPAAVTARMLNDPFQTPVLDIDLMHKGVAVERRQVALCEVPNRNQQLKQQIEHFAELSTATPFILRTNGFPKSKTAQAATAISLIESMQGMQLDISDTEWTNLQRADEFASEHRQSDGFLDWRRDRQWLTQLLSPLDALIELPPTYQPFEHEARDAHARISPQSPTENAFAIASDAAQQPKSQSAFPVLIGAGDDGKSIYWAPYSEPPDHLNNFGFVITGDAGSGKTQTIKILIDAAARSDLSLCIFDFKADYCDAKFVDPLGIEVIDIRKRGLPFNPLQPPPRGASGVQPIEHAHEMAGVLGRIFKLGAVQQGLLRDAVCSVYEANEIPVREWVHPESVVWPLFDQVTALLSDEPKAAAIITKLSLLTDLGLMGEAGGAMTSFADFVEQRVSLKLSDLPTDEVKAAIAEMIIIQLHGYALRGDQPRRLKRMMVFDEAHRVRSSARLETLAREGRAFGIGIVIGTQFPGDIPDSMAGNLATQLFLLNAMADHRRYTLKQMYGTTGGREAKDMMDRLAQLKPFDGLFNNAHHQRSFVHVLPHYKRCG